MDRTSASRRETLFHLDGRPPIGAAVSMALQHLVAMIVGCVTPAIIVANTVGLGQEDRVLLIQASLVASAVSTLLQLYPIAGRFGSGLPVIMGISFAYVPSMQAAASAGGVSAIAGAMVVGGAVALLVGIFVRRIRTLFPPVITGTVIFTIGLSLYPTAINYMAGGSGNTYDLVVTQQGLPEALVYGSWQNWLVAAVTLAAVLALNHYTRGFCKMASILLGMAVADRPPPAGARLPEQRDPVPARGGAAGPLPPGRARAGPAGGLPQRRPPARGRGPRRRRPLCPGVGRRGPGPRRHPDPPRLISRPPAPRQAQTRGTPAHHCRPGQPPFKHTRRCAERGVFL